LVTGRPPVTTHAEIERAAFDLFATRGFEATTLEAIAERLGVARRTVARYYRSKNDLAWGRFDATLTQFAGLLDAMPTDLPLWEAIHRATVTFNDFPAGAQPSHLERMRLILRTPALVAHSELRYAEWRAVIERYAARRLGVAATDLLPRTIGRVSLALALSTYELWLEDPTQHLPSLLASSMSALREYLGVAHLSEPAAGAAS
jgi:mycofactocin system transcriptional regulator